MADEKKKEDAVVEETTTEEAAPVAEEKKEEKKEEAAPAADDASTSEVDETVEVPKEFKKIVEDVEKMSVLELQPAKPTIRPATIQPMVPHTLTLGNSKRSRWVNAIVFPSPSVGM